MEPNRIAHWLGATFLAGIVAALLLGAASPSIYTPWTAFKGTNGTSIKTNPASPVVIVDGSPGVNIASNSLVSQISAAQVWQVSTINGNIRLVTNSPTFFSVQVDASATSQTTSFGFEPGGIGAENDFATSVGNGTNVIYSANLGAFGQIHNTYFDLRATDSGLDESLSFILHPDLGPNVHINSFGSNTVGESGFFIDGSFAATTTKTTNGTPLDVKGIGSFFAGIATLSSAATNAVTATGVTNTASIDRQAFVSATATSFTINDRSGAVLYTSPTLTATLNIRLQPGWSVRAASGLVGTVIP